MPNPAKLPMLSVKNAFSIACMHVNAYTTCRCDHDILGQREFELRNSKRDWHTSQPIRHAGGDGGGAHRKCSPPKFPYWMAESTGLSSGFVLYYTPSATGIACRGEIEKKKSITKAVQAVDYNHDRSPSGPRIRHWVPPSKKSIEPHLPCVKLTKTRCLAPCVIIEHKVASVPM